MSKTKMAADIVLEAKNIYCEPCKREGKLEKANGVCVTCEEHFCGPCFSLHRRFKIAANHVLQDEDPNSFVKPEALGEKCQSHPSKLAEYYCEACDTIICEVCVTFNHTRCANVTNRTSIARDLAKSSEFTDYSKKLDSIQKRLQAQRDKVDYMVGTNCDMRKQAEDELKQRRIRMNEHLEKLENETIQAMNVIEKENASLIKNMSENLDRVETMYKKIKSDLDLKKPGDACQLFIIMKRGRHTIQKIEDQLENLREEKKVQKYALVPPRSKEMVDHIAPGIFAISTSQLEQQISTDTDKDSQTPGIKDLTIVNGHYCVVSDTKNRSMKVIDTKSTSVTSIAITTEYVLGVSAINEDHFAASVLKQGRWQVLMFCINDAGCIVRTSKRIDIGKSGFNEVVHGKNRIFVRHDEEVQILDMEGHFIKSSKFEKTGRVKFGLIHGIAESNDGSSIYVTDGEENTITSFTSDGFVKHVYQDKDMVNPWGITVDNDGFVYVCSYGTSSIHQLTADLEKIQVIIEDFHGSCITFSSAENKLYLGSGKFISVYKLEKK